MKKIKYFAIIAASIFTLTSCTDIVEVDDLKAKENKPSTGAPTVDKVVLATDAEFPIEGANFEQVVRIEGTNLGDITSLKFNDIEVDSKEIYSTYDMLLAPIPRARVRSTPPSCVTTPSLCIRSALSMPSPAASSSPTPSLNSVWMRRATSSSATRC